MDGSDPQLVRVVDIALSPKDVGSDSVYTYALPIGGEVGDAFFVPLGERATLGIAIRIWHAGEDDLAFPIAKLKPVIRKVEGLQLPQSVLDLARFASEEYACSWPTALAAATPPAVRERLVSAWQIELDHEEHGEAKKPRLTDVQREVLQVIREQGGTWIESRGKRLTPPLKQALEQLRKRGFVKRSVAIRPPSERRESTAWIRLSRDITSVERFLAEEGRSKPAQVMTLLRIQEAGDRPLSLSDVRALAGVTDTTLKALHTAGLIERIEAPSGSLKAPPEPNAAQSHAIDAISQAIHQCASKRFLLFGVTGSGKTEVFLRCAAEALRAGRSVLYLVPEIALTAQVVGQLRERFGPQVAVLHSELAAGERLENWSRIRSGQAPIVLGARSALFAPMESIGLIVLDEEHEASYKQETAPRYHAKRLAEWLSNRHGAPLVMGSATPSFETYTEALAGSVELLELPRRAIALSMPKVQIVDLTKGYASGRASIFSPPLLEALRQTLGASHQAIIFLNRRAYAPFMICRDCGKRFTCPNCAVSLTFHRNARKLKCHHCGHQEEAPAECPRCLGHKVTPFGIGTERVEEALKHEFPDASVARLDRDVTAKRGSLERILTDFRAGQIQVLVGTQMVAKGLDFPNVTLVGVVAADLSLNVQDFRAAERTFQLLTQVSGRSGRGHHEGQVVVQTLNPEHEAVRFAQAHDFVSFYNASIRERREARFPPESRLVNIQIQGSFFPDVDRAARSVALQLRTALKEATILGPVTCPIERLDNRWRMHVLVKLDPKAPVSPLVQALSVPAPNGVSVVIDVDPYSMV